MAFYSSRPKKRKPRVEDFPVDPELEQYADTDIDELYPQGRRFRLSFDPVTRKFKLLSKYPEDLEKISEAFSAPNKAAFYAQQYGYAAEDKLYAVNKFGYFAVGMLYPVLEHIRLVYGSSSCIAVSNACRNFIKARLTPLKDFADKLASSDWSVSEVSLDTSRNKQLEAEGKQPFKLRDYQEKMIKSLILDGKGRGLVESPTASGKSYMIANFIWTLHKQYDPNLRYLIFVPNCQLVDQFWKDLIDYGFKPEWVTRFRGGLPKKDGYNPDAMVIVGNRQYIFTNKDKLPKFDVLIADEVHSDTADSTALYVETCPAKIKVGCSGTLPRDKWKRWSLMGMFGKILHVEEITDLQSRGYISKLNIKVVDVTDSSVESNRDLLFNVNSNRSFDIENPNDVQFDESYKAELNYIDANYEKLYTPAIGEIAKLKGNVLVLFDRIEFGTAMYEYVSELKPRGSDIFYIDGSTDIEIREDVRSKFEASSNNILLANVAIMSTGINIKNLNSVVFIFSTKSVSRVIQSIGRMLRLHKDKDVATLIDCRFNFKYSRRHFLERMKLYREFYLKKKPDEIVKVTI